MTRGLEVVRGVRFAPALVTARAVKAALAVDAAEAERLLADALALSEEAGARYAEGRVHLALAELAERRGARESVARHLAAAHARFREVGAPAWVHRTADVARSSGIALATGS